MFEPAPSNEPVPHYQIPLSEAPGGHPFQFSQQPQSGTLPPAQPQVGQPGYASPYEPAQATGSYPGYGPTPKGSPRFGYVGLVLGVLAMALGATTGVLFGRMVIDVITGLAAQGIYLDYNDFNLTYQMMYNLPPEMLQSLSGIVYTALALLIVGSLIGIIGLVLSIIATAKNQGRAFGIWGIILTVLAPIVTLIVYMCMAMTVIVV
jgi:hypothetical protein